MCTAIAPAATSPTFQLDYIPGRFAVVIYNADQIESIDREFLTWRDARSRARFLSTLHTGSDNWVAAIPQPVVRATFEPADA